MKLNCFMDVIEEASMVSLFSKIKVIIVNNFVLDNLTEDELDYLEKFVNSKNSDVYIILISDKIDARKKSYKLFKDNFSIIEADKSNDSDLSKYIVDRIKDNGYKIDNYNVEYLLSKIGADINNINNELDKLFIYKSDDKNINREDIDLLVFNNIDNVIYEFTNAILDNDMDKVKLMYDKFMLDNVGVDYLISTIASSLRVSLIIKLLNNKNMTNSEIAKVIGKKEFFVKKSLDRLYRYTVNDLENFIVNLAIIDRNLKNGKDNVGRFDLFLFNREENY